MAMEDDLEMVEPRQWRTLCEIESVARFAYRPDIDGLRAVAVFGVVIFHLKPSLLPGGFSGVDIFFVISGFVVSGSMLKEPCATSTEFFVGFYVRRAKRIAPALLLAVLATAIALQVLVPPLTPALDGYYLSGMLALLGVANIRYATLQDGGGYFNDGNGPDSLQLNPFLHTWSLGVEEQFYFVLPLLFFMTHGARVAKTASTRPVWCAPLAMLGVCVAVSALASAIMTVTQQQFAFFTLPSRFWELGLGAMMSLKINSRAPTSWGWFGNAVLELAAVSLIVAGLLFTPEETGFPFPGALAAVCGAMCFIAAGSRPGAFINGYLSHWLPVYMGKLSYPIYLWHWPVLVMLKWALGADTMASATGLLGALVLSLALAAATFHFVESPCRQWYPRRQWWVMLVVLPAILSVELVLITLRGSAAGHHYEPLPPQPALANNTCQCRVTDPTFHTPPGARAPNASNPCSHLPPCFTAVRGWHGGSAPHFKTDMCWRGHRGNHPLPPLPSDWRAVIDGCLEGSVTREPGQRLLFLVGDSHAEHFLPAFQMLEASGSVAIRHFASLCGFAPRSAHESFYSKEDGLWETLCRDVNAAEVADLVAFVQPGDIVAVSNIAMKLPEGAPIADYRTLLLRLYDDVISPRRAWLLVLEDSPYLPKRGTSCLPTALNPRAAAGCQTAKDAAELYVHPARSMLASLEADHPYMFFFDFHGLLCDDHMCGALVPGTQTLAIWDTHHLTEYGAAYLAPFLCSYMNDAGMFA